MKGHISEMVLRLEDEDERIQNLVKLFFHELSNKGEFLRLFFLGLALQTEVIPDILI